MAAVPKGGTLAASWRPLLPHQAPVFCLLFYGWTTLVPAWLLLQDFEEQLAGEAVLLEVAVLPVA